MSDEPRDPDSQSNDDPGTAAEAVEQMWGDWDEAEEAAPDGADPDPESPPSQYAPVGRFGAKADKGRRRNADPIGSSQSSEATADHAGDSSEEPADTTPVDETAASTSSRRSARAAARASAKEEKAQKRIDRAEERAAKSERRSEARNAKIAVKQQKAEERKQLAETEAAEAKRKQDEASAPQPSTVQELDEPQEPESDAEASARAERIRLKARKLELRAERVDVGTRSSRARKMDRKRQRIAERTDKKLARQRAKEVKSERRKEARAEKRARRAEKARLKAQERAQGEPGSVRRQRAKAEAKVRKQRKKLDKARAREALKDEKARKRTRRRAIRQLKAPKVRDKGDRERKSRGDGDRTDRRKKGEPKAQKPPKAERRKAKAEAKAAGLRQPPRRRAEVLLVDGTEVCYAVLRNRRVVAANISRFEDYDLAVEAAAKKRMARLIWANRVDASYLSPLGDRVKSERAVELVQAESLRTVFNQDEKYRLSTILAPARLSDPEFKPTGLAMPKRWQSHRLFTRNAGRVIASGQCSGSEPGLWLRLGNYATEMTYVDSDGRTCEWASMPPITLPADRVGDAPPNLGSGTHAVSCSAQLTSDEEAAERYITLVTQFVDDRAQEWGRRHQPVDTLWVHGPGVRATGLMDALIGRSGLRVAPPVVDASPDVADTDQLVAVLNAWGRPTFGDPTKAIAAARRQRVRKVISWVLYGCAAVALLVALSAWQGHSRNASISESNARAEAANARLAAAQSVAPPDPQYGLTGALRWAGCETAAADQLATVESTDDLPLSVAVPTGYLPTHWPEGWETEIIAFSPVAVSGLAPQTNTNANDLLAEHSRALAAADLFASGQISDEAGDGIFDDIDAAFEAEGASPSLWRLFAWGRLHFAGQQAYTPPPGGTHLCAAPTVDLLDRAQNDLLLGLRVAQWLQTEVGHEFDADGELTPTDWRISNLYEEVFKDDDEAPAISLKQQHDADSFELTVFGAFTVNEQDLQDLLRTLAFAQWPENAGTAQITTGFERECRAGIDIFTGDPKITCGATAEVRMGPRFLIGTDAQGLRPDEPDAEEVAE